MIGEEEESITLNDYYEREKKDMEEAIAIVGGGDHSECSYINGYLDRQAVYKCNTCDPLNEISAGVCYACSLNCHSDHDIIELYTKRKFRCDCGNSKFENFKCSLYEGKDEMNMMNVYNQNFKGLYCTCHRPYPDPDNQEEDEMIQCVLCEDWFHEKHIGGAIPTDYGEFICKECLKEHSFLQYYNEMSVPSDGASTSQSNPLKRKHDETTEENVIVDEGRITSGDEKTVCMLKKFKSVNAEWSSDELRALFFVEDWRKKLCRCSECRELYQSQGIGYLLQETDTLSHHEMRGIQKVNGEWESAVNSIGELDHVRKIELIQGLQEFKQGLSDFLTKFTDGQIIQKEHVEGFIEEMNNRKRRRFEEGYGIPPDTCK